MGLHETYPETSSRPRDRRIPQGAFADRRMLTLFHHPFCPHSRFIRLSLGEYGIPVRLIEERVWERRQEFLIINPACTTPVLVQEGYPSVPGAALIAEYLDETKGSELGELRLLPSEPGRRIEVRRLTSWFNDKFFAEVSGPLTNERLYKRHMPASAGGGSPETEVLRVARHNIRYHLAYIGWLVRTRDWLAGDRMSYADLAAASHLSAADYLGDVPWNEDEVAKSWYARVKSRPSFRPLLSETLAGIPPSATYADLDF
jgi:glutathione S-transferase